MNRSIVRWFLIGVLLLSPSLVFSDTHGSVRGRAWDQTGAVVTGALVTVQNIIDGEIWTGRTNERGEYEIGFIRAGHYRITGEAKGFRTILHFIMSANYAFGSAFPDASDGLFGRCVTENCRLPKSSTVNLTIGKELTGNTDIRLEIENLTNRVYPINLGSEFNGSHVSAPRLVTLRLVYHFQVIRGRLPKSITKNDVFGHRVRRPFLPPVTDEYLRHSPPSPRYSLIRRRWACKNANPGGGVRHLTVTPIPRGQ